MPIVGLQTKTPVLGKISGGTRKGEGKTAELKNSPAFIIGGETEGEKKLIEFLKTDKPATLHFTFLENDIDSVASHWLKKFNAKIKKFVAQSDGGEHAWYRNTEKDNERTYCTHAELPASVKEGLKPYLSLKMYFPGLQQVGIFYFATASVRGVSNIIGALRSAKGVFKTLIGVPFILSKEEFKDAQFGRTNYAPQLIVDPNWKETMYKLALEAPIEADEDTELLEAPDEEVEADAETGEVIEKKTAHVEIEVKEEKTVVDTKPTSGFATHVKDTLMKLYPSDEAKAKEKAKELMVKYGKKSFNDFTEEEQDKVLVDLEAFSMENQIAQAQTEMS